MPKALLKLHPKPIFVIKTKRLTPYPPIKLFINLAHAPEVPAPQNLEDFKTNSQHMYALIMDSKWDIPIVTSSMRNDTDKRGNECVVYDCVVNSTVVEYILGDDNVSLRDILVEWCIESIEVSDRCIVSRDDIKFPKLKVKGALCEDLKVPADGGSGNVEDGDEIHNLLELRRELADDSGFDGPFSGSGDGEESKIVIPGLTPPQPTSSIMRNQSPTSNVPLRPLVQDITETWQGRQEKHATERNTDEKRGLSELKDVTFDVYMRKTYDTSKYRLRINIAVSQPLKPEDLDLRFDRAENKLVLALSGAARDIYKLSKPLELLLPTYVKQDKLSPKEFKVFLLKPSSSICIFI